MIDGASQGSGASNVLVLVDLDNVAGKAKNWPILTTFSPLLALAAWASAHALDRPGVVVVVALNTTTAKRVRGAGNRRDNINALALSLIGALGGTNALTVPCELALGLTVPQSSDRQLVRLLGQAAVPSRASTFAHVILLSRDAGLRSAIGKALHLTAATQAFHQANTFVFTPHKHARLAPPDMTAPPASATALPHAPSLLIDDPKLASAAGSHRLQRPTSGDELASLAEAAEDIPLLITQCGLTDRAAPGAARGVFRCSMATATVQRCEPDDGLVLGRPVAGHVYPTSGGSAVASSVGPGAIHLRTPGITVRTDVPVPLLCAISSLQTARPLALMQGAWLLDPASLSAAPATGGNVGYPMLDDHEALDPLGPAARALGALTPSLMARLTWGGDRLKCALIDGAGEPVDDWWWTVVCSNQGRLLCGSELHLRLNRRALKTLGQCPPSGLTVPLVAMLQSIKQPSTLKGFYCPINARALAFSPLTNNAAPTVARVATKKVDGGQLGIARTSAGEEIVFLASGPSPEGRKINVRPFVTRTVEQRFAALARLLSPDVRAKRDVVTPSLMLPIFVEAT